MNNLFPPAPPQVIEDETDLEDVLSRPSAELVEFIRHVRSPLMVLGAGGKMGPTLATMARRAATAADCNLRVIAVSRFTNAALRDSLERRGVETVSVDLLDREAIARLPAAGDVIYLVGLKFGTAQNPAPTWAINTLVPANVAERYPASRMVALSTGNVYPPVPADTGGAAETHPLAPLGEYPNAAVARERIFEFEAQRHPSSSMVLVRLNYAVELRYGVLHDIGRKVWAGEPVELNHGYFNCIWQGDANDRILRLLGHAANPPLTLNLTGPDVLSVRTVAEQFGRLMDRPVKFTGSESKVALLSNSARASGLLGRPPTPLEAVLRWTADWIMRGGPSLNKPTHFEVLDGQY